MLSFEHTKNTFYSGGRAYAEHVPPKEPDHVHDRQVCNCTRYVAQRPEPGTPIHQVGIHTTVKYAPVTSDAEKYFFPGEITCSFGRTLTPGYDSDNLLWFKLSNHKYGHTDSGANHIYYMIKKNKIHFEMSYPGYGLVGCIFASLNLGIVDSPNNGRDHMFGDGRKSYSQRMVEWQNKIQPDDKTFWMGELKKGGYGDNSDLVVKTFSDPILLDVVQHCNTISSYLDKIYDQINQHTSIEDYAALITKSPITDEFALLEPWLRSYDLTKSDLFPILKEFDQQIH